MPTNQPSAIASSRQLYQGQPIPLLTPPTAAPTLAASGTGGTLPANTYWVAYSFINSTGQETTVSPAASQAVTSGQTLTVTLPTLSGNVVGMNVYIGTSSGGITKQNGAAVTGTTFTQSSALAAGAAPPATNAAAAQLIYQAPASSTNVPAPNATGMLTEILITNTSANPAGLDLYLVPSGGQPSAANKLIPSIAQIAGGQFSPSGPMRTNMPPGSSLMAAQTVASSLTLTISGVEVQ